ncbi:hypothetical protein DID78_02755 [Candidatus Marinamargulisbacteria bacterium SCGC AG-343-D04]|nr:hypothetical protein DID78_02755 [Candidatus Marinamargulisbacteria bacterium SCGC AG-343-D04]
MFHSQESIFLSAQCDSQCFGCFLDSDKIFSLDKWKTIFSNGSFFSYFKSSRFFNVFGGDPCLNLFFLPLVRFLNKEGCFVRVWVSPSVSVESIVEAQSYVNEWCIYVPAFESEYYQLQVGDHSFSDFLKKVDDLRSDHVDFKLHTGVTMNNAAYLPELVEFALQKNIKLVLHYNKKAISKELRKDIHYFEHHSFVRVLKMCSDYTLCSCKVPASDSYFSKALFFSEWRSFFRRIQTYFRV